MTTYDLNSLTAFCNDTADFGAASSNPQDYNCEIIPYSESSKIVSRGGEISSQTKIVNLHFTDKESRNKYLQDYVNYFEFPLEHKVLQHIGKIKFRRYNFDYYWNNATYDDYNIYEYGNKFTGPGYGPAALKEKLNKLGVFTGIAPHRWQMYVDYPTYSSDPEFPTVKMETTNHSVRFLYTCDFNFDPNIIAVMDYQQAKSTYEEVTFNAPSAHLSLEQLKEQLIDYCDMEKSKNIITNHARYGSEVMDERIRLPGVERKFTPKTIVAPDTIAYNWLDHKRSFFIFDGSKTKFTICAAQSTDLHPKWAKDRAATAWCDGLEMSGLAGDEILRTAQVPDDGKFIFNVYLGYRLDANQTEALVFFDGYGEAVEEIKAAKQAAQELRSLYIAYANVFEDAFKAILARPEYADLMLNEELLTIYDSGPEVAVINEQLFHLGYGSTPNGYNYTSETYDGVIKFKDYLKELDSDLYDILNIGTPCGDHSIHPKCNSNSQDGPCGCWTYSCYVFKEVTSRASNEDDAQVKWTSHSRVNSPFKEIVPNGVQVNGTSTIFVDNEDGLGNRSIHATVNNGYEVKVRIWAHGYLNNNTSNLVRLAPDDSDLSTNIPLVNGERLTPFASPTGDAYYLDLTLRGSDVLKVDAVVDINKPFLIGLNRTSPTGQIRTVDVGSVTLFSNGPFSIEKLELQVLDVRPPFADWKIHGHSSPPGWGRVNGVAGITLVAENFSDGLYDTAPPPCSFGIQIEIFLGINVFYIFEIEIGGFVGLKLNFGIENGGGNYAHNFISGKYVQASVDIGLAKASGRVEATDEWEWQTPKQLGYAVKDWLNDFIEVVDADYKLPLPKGYAGRTSKTTSKVETEVLGQKVSQSHETLENAVSLEFVRDDLSIFNATQVYTNQSKQETRVSFGRKWEDSVTVGAASPKLPAASFAVTNPTLEKRALFASLE